MCGIKPDRNTTIETDDLVSGIAPSSCTKVGNIFVTVRELVGRVAAVGEG